MKTHYQKIIAGVLVIALILSLNLNLIFLKPKQAKATDLGGSLLVAIKEIIGDAVSSTISDMLLKRLMVKIQNWGLGRDTDTLSPFAVSDWVDYFKSSLAAGTAQFIMEYDKIWNLRDEIDKKTKGVLDALAFGTYDQDLLPYSQYARSTLRQDLGSDYDRYIRSGQSLREGGWKAWFSLIKPQNTVFGQIMMASNAREVFRAAEKAAKDKETDVGGGYEDEKKTVATDVDKCKEDCLGAAEQDSIFDYCREDFCGGDRDPVCESECITLETQSCQQECEAKPGYSLEETVVNWGSTIHEYMGKVPLVELDKLVDVKEITQLVGIFFSAIANKVVHLGLNFVSSLFSRDDPQEKVRASQQEKYSYRRSFEKDQTPEKIDKTRTDTLSGIQKAMQELSRSIVSCNKDEMMKFEEYAKNVADVLDGYVEALYVGLEGINLKPDFEVLTPRIAPFSVFGYSWGHIPYQKFPSECRRITDSLDLGAQATCRWITSGLEPISPVSGETRTIWGLGDVTFGDEVTGATCEQCMYDHDALFCPPEPYPPQPYTGTDPWNEQQLQQKNNYYWACKGPHNTVLNHCDECLKRADDHCSELEDPLQKDRCIRNYCSNYTAVTGLVTTPPADGLAFYNQCLLEEKKESCYTCLREYYMPATYCEQTADYVARSIIKYPALVLWGRSSRLGDRLVSDVGLFVGPEDEYITTLGDRCSDNYATNNDHTIDIGLICRILPDYVFGGGFFGLGLGSGITCKDYCPIPTDTSGNPTMTDEEWDEKLRDITDFRPNSRDCNSARAGIGGTEPWHAIGTGTREIKGKCCAAMSNHDTALYSFCVGSGALSETPPEEDHANQFCPAAVAACSDWFDVVKPDWEANWNPTIGGWESDTVIDSGGLTNRSIEFQNQWFQQAVGGTVSGGHLITLVDPNVVIRITSPYCWKPQQCCNDDSSYERCMATIPNIGEEGGNKCRIGSGELRQGYTQERDLAVGFVGGARVDSSGSAERREGQFEPMWVPDREFMDGEEWQHYGYCSYCPESDTPEDCMFGPLDDWAWHRSRNLTTRINPTRLFADGTRAVWQDNNQSGDTCYNNEDCTGRCSIDLDGEHSKEINLAGDWWIAIRGNADNNMGGAAICRDR